MSAELERAYAKLAEKADKEKIPSFYGVLARARQRRRRTVNTTLSAIAVLAVFAGVAFLPRFEEGPMHGNGRVFVTFDAAAGQVITYPSPVQFAMTATDGQRSYVMWWGEDNREWVAAIDLATGQTPWAPISLGTFGDTNGMVASPGAILLLTEGSYDNLLIHDNRDTIVAVDPLTGKVMWTLPYSFNDTDRVLYSDTLVISWNKTGKTEALDLRTGNPKWTVTDPLAPGGVNAMRDHREFESYGGWSGLPVPTDKRVVLHFVDGRVQIRDVGTGNVLSERSGATAEPGGWRETVIGDSLYWTDPRGVMRASLTGSQAPTRLNTPASSDERTRVEPCGPELICVVTGKEIVAIDERGREAWRISTPTGVGTFASTSGIATLDNEGHSAAYDLKGSQFLPAEYRSGAALWLDADSLLIFQTTGITAYSLSRRVGIMLAPNRVTGYCSWNAMQLVCPTQTGISVWTYAVS
ncbi:hypothetical protein Rhe02_41280 [Rhizocola hellebori]|uniref:Pyrrolo-quinoline quinone repeat domain-containing protein n=1 Tax=Rhizocola hellebori TaxID=1392758 RepID=A0A8J3Q8X0_9ACTN|nr:PQQ-binding-like beta-propeller repeat protein [Rhizocola hellebori]GIH06061.1 hypothetical protein Rhe02_41280 [Rhizocola hellebori]